jgi:two-component system chemotaxis response regulator CheY
MTSILVIEDSLTVRAVIGRFLRAAGYHLVETDAAEEALQLLQEFSFELVIADINLPQMDGVSFVKEMRARAPVAKLPVLILTGDKTDDIQARCTRAGASGFVRKPIAEEHLLSVVSGLIQTQRAQPR